MDKKKIDNFNEILKECVKYKDGKTTSEELNIFFNSIIMEKNLGLYDLDILVSLIDIEYKKMLAEDEGYKMDYYIYVEMYTMFYYMTAKLSVLIEEYDINVDNYDLLSKCGFFDFLIDSNKNQYDLFVRLSANKHNINAVYAISDLFNELKEKKDLSIELDRFEKTYKGSEFKEALKNLGMLED